MRLQLWRHATVLIEFAGKRLLLDPVLAKKGSRPPIPSTANLRLNPLVGLPFPQAELGSRLATLDAVLVTHRHGDHLDPCAARALPHDKPAFCQPDDAESLHRDGFTDAQPIAETIAWDGISITRTDGQHGLGRADLGPVSGFMLRAESEPTLYITGDSVMCAEVEEALSAHRPDVILAFAGGAQLPFGKTITMDVEDLSAVRAMCPEAEIVVVHMEAFNHCGLKREALRDAAAAGSWLARLHVPDDGEWLEFSAGVGGGSEGEHRR